MSGTIVFGEIKGVRYNLRGRNEKGNEKGKGIKKGHCSFEPHQCCPVNFGSFSYNIFNYMPLQQAITVIDLNLVLLLCWYMLFYQFSQIRS